MAKNTDIEVLISDLSAGSLSPSQFESRLSQLLAQLGDEARSTGEPQPLTDEDLERAADVARRL